MKTVTVKANERGLQIEVKLNNEVKERTTAFEMGGKFYLYDDHNTEPYQTLADAVQAVVDRVAGKYTLANEVEVAQAVETYLYAALEVAEENEDTIVYDEASTEEEEEKAVAAAQKAYDHYNNQTFKIRALVKRWAISIGFYNDLAPLFLASAKDTPEGASHREKLVKTFRKLDATTITC